jgi:hypothetical protein
MKAREKRQFKRTTDMTRAMASVVSLLLSATAVAQSAARDQLIDQIEEAIGKPMPVAAGSLEVTTVLKAAKQANPAVDQGTWRSVESDTAAVLTKLGSGPGSRFDIRIRGALEGFTDTDLKNLATRLNDPLLLRFRDVLQKLPREKPNLLAGMFQIAAQINDILAAHHLNEVSLQ